MRVDNKKIGALIFVLIMLTLFVLAISEGGTHGADNIFVSVKGYKMSLQQAVNNNFLKAGGPSPSGNLTTSTSGAFHSLDEIFVSVSGNDITLQSAINSGSLCSSSSGSYSGNVILGHKGDELTLSSGKSLQQAINDGDYCASCSTSSWSPSTSTVCSGTSFTQTSNCGDTRGATGTKDCTPACTVSSWSPSTSAVCSGQSFTQTSNCGTTRSSTGTKYCCTNDCPSFGTICSGDNVCTCSDNDGDGCLELHSCYNCGRSGQIYTDSICSGGSCQCANPNYFLGVANCDGNWANGCETMLGGQSNCGSCGDRCSSYQTCQKNVCIDYHGD